MRILVVEDDISLAEGILQALADEGYTVDHLTNGREALAALQQESFDAVILDIGLPEIDGFAVLSQARKKKVATPILLLTARDSVDDRIEGLDKGADDYLIKPFDVNELKARLRALIRRSAGRSNPLLTYGEIVLDPANLSVTYQGDPVSLARKEYALLKELIENRGRVLTRDRLEQSLYGWEDEVESNALEVHIHHLRKKFYNELIKTVRGVGYMVEQEKQT